MGWQIAGPIIGFVGIVVVITLYILPRREKIKIMVTKPSYSANDYDRVLRVFWSGEVQRLGGEEVRYASHICLKPDAQTYHKLKKYFRLPEDGVIKTLNRLELARGIIVSTGHGVNTGVYPEYGALMKANDIEKWKIARQLLSELEQKTHRISLVWEDKPTRKLKWKIMRKEDYVKWVRL